MHTKKRSAIEKQKQDMTYKCRHWGARPGHEKLSQYSSSQEMCL